MEGIFLSILNLSITASYLILAILILRIFLKKTPRWLICALWAFVGIRLVFPFSIESVLSLIPSTKTFDPERIFSTAPVMTSGIPIIDSTVNPIIVENFTPVEQAAEPSINNFISITSIAAVVWLTGLSLILLYGIISYILIRRRVIGAVRLDNEVWQSEGAPSPFILGIFRPKIYIPFGMDDESFGYVIAHEKAHIKRLDHFIKPFGFALLAVYWFNPLVWIAYVLLCRDIELACDEKVVRQMDEDSRKAYAKALLACGVGRKRISACPLAFGEVGVRERVKGVMNYKKPAFWIILIAIVAFICTAVFFLTSPKDNTETQEQTVFGTSSFDRAILKGAGSDYGDRVKVFVNDISVRNGSPQLDITLKNSSGLDLTYGTPYSVYYMSEGEKIDCDAFSGERVWTSIAHVLKSGGSKEFGFRMDDHDLSKKGLYRFEHEFWLGEDYETKYYAWVEFELEEPLQAIKVSAYEYIDTEAVYMTSGIKYFEIINSTSADSSDLPGNIAFDINIPDENTVRITLAEQLELNGNLTDVFTITSGEPVTLNTPETGTMQYVFEITDMPEDYRDSDPQFQVYISDIPTYEDAVESGSYGDRKAFVENFVGTRAILDTMEEKSAPFSDTMEVPLGIAKSYEEYEAIMGERIDRCQLRSWNETTPEDFFERKSLIIFGGMVSGELILREFIVNSGELSITVDSFGGGNTASWCHIIVLTVDKELIEDCSIFNSYHGIYYGVGSNTRWDFYQSDISGVLYMRTHSASQNISYNDPALWELSETPDVCNIASQPIIYKTDNREELEALRSRLSGFFDLDSRFTINGHECDHAFNEVVTFSDAIYEKNSVFFIFDPGQNSSTRYLLDSVKVENEKMTIRYDILYRHDAYIPANRFIIVFVDKDYIKDCTEFIAERGHMIDPAETECYKAEGQNNNYILLINGSEARIHLGDPTVGAKEYTYTRSGNKITFVSVDDPSKQYVAYGNDESPDSYNYILELEDRYRKTGVRSLFESYTYP